MQHMKNKNGFTIIELIMVMIIIGVLAAIAMPQYNKYVVRTQVAEAFALLAPVKKALTLYYQETGKFPDQTALTARHDALGIPRHNQYAASADYVQQIRVKRTSGQIQVRFDGQAQGVNALIAGKRFDLRPVESSGAITSWFCHTNAPRGAWIDREYIKSCN